MPLDSSRPLTVTVSCVTGRHREPPWRQSAQLGDWCRLLFPPLREHSLTMAEEAGANGPVATVPPAEGNVEDGSPTAMQLPTLHDASPEQKETTPASETPRKVSLFGRSPAPVAPKGGLEESSLSMTDAFHQKNMRVLQTTTRDTGKGKRTFIIGTRLFRSTHKMSA